MLWRRGKDVEVETLCGTVRVAISPRCGGGYTGGKQGGGARGIKPSLLKSFHCIQGNKDTANVGFSGRGAVPFPGHGALYAMPLYTGGAGGFGLLVSAEILRVRINLAPVPLGCRVNSIIHFLTD